MGLSYYRPPKENVYTTKVVSGTITYQATTDDNGIGVGSLVQTVLLPSEPLDNQRLKIFDYQQDAFSNNITINGNGNTINNEPTITINTDGGSVEIIFLEGTWHVTSFVN